METGLLHTHNILRWAVVLFGLLTLFTAMRGLNGKRDFTLGDKRTALYFLISCDIQLLLGLALYYFKGYYRNFSDGAMKEVMHNTISRFWTIEHTVGMLLAIILVHIGYAATKGKRPHVVKFRRLFWCTLIALVLIAAMVPWPSRMAGIARPLFPGM